MTTIDMDLLDTFNKDMRSAAQLMEFDEARFIVDLYYTWQRQRIRTKNQVTSSEHEPYRVLGFINDQAEKLEKFANTALSEFAKSQPVCRWAMSNKGIGPVIASGLFCYIDITRAPNVGHIWSFAGLTTNAAWLGTKKAEDIVKVFRKNDELTTQELIDIARKAHCCPKWLARRVYRVITQLDIPDLNLLHQVDDATYIETLFATSNSLRPKLKAVVLALSKRPWNQDLKTLCWKIGESFVKVSGQEDAFYGQLYKKYKVEYELLNGNGQYKDQAADILAAKNWKADTQSKQALEAGRLPQAQIHARAKRRAVKMFLSHWHEVAYRLHYGEAPPKPYALAYLGHSEYIAPPNMEGIV